MGWHPTVEVRWRPWCARRNPVGSCRGLHEIAHPHQVVHGRGEGEQPADPLEATEFDFAQQPHRLQPPEDLFDPFALLLTHGVAGMAGGPSINGTGTVRRVLGHMGRDLHRPQILDERVRVVVFVAPQRHTLSARALADHCQRRLPLRRTGRLGEARIHDQSMPVLHQDMTQEAQLGLLARRLLVQPGLRIGRRGVCGIRPSLASEIHTGIARIIRRRPGRGVALPLEALLARPGLDQRAVDREVLIGQQAMGLGLRQDLLEERRGHLARQQAVPVLREDGHIPHRRVQIKADKPAKQQVVLQRLHQKPFTAKAVEHLQQQGAQQLLRGNRGPARVGIQLRQLGRQRGQGRVHVLLDGPQWMGRWYALLRREIAEHPGLLGIRTTHREPPGVGGR